MRLDMIKEKHPALYLYNGGKRVGNINSVLDRLELLKWIWSLVGI
jgi:hypothetical protein